MLIMDIFFFSSLSTILEKYGAEWALTVKFKAIAALVKGFSSFLLNVSSVRAPANPFLSFRYILESSHGLLQNLRHLCRAQHLLGHKNFQNVLNPHHNGKQPLSNGQ